MIPRISPIRRRHMLISNPADLSHKRVLDDMLLKLSGVEAGEMTGLLAYFVGKKMFACICNGGVGVRLPAAEAANLQFSRETSFRLSQRAGRAPGNGFRS